MESNSIVGEDGFYACPNAIAVLHVSPKAKTVTQVKTFSTKLASLDSKPIESEKTEVKKGGNKSTSKKDKASASAIDKMWKMLGLGKIDISYACVGYTLDGRPILDHSCLVDLLVNYGFDIDSVMEFIDDFAKSSSNSSSQAPIVMMSAQMAKIMSDIVPLDDDDEE